MKFIIIPAILLISGLNTTGQSPVRARDHGIEIGVLKTGKFNAITDVNGVKVGHVTLINGEDIRTGVTAILPHPWNIFQQKVPAAIYIGNGFGKLTGYSQVEELGNIETPIILTNTLFVPTASNGLISYTLQQQGNEDVRSVNPIIGETNDGWLNDIQGRHTREEHVLEAIQNAAGGPVTEGNVGAGTGTILPIHWSPGSPLWWSPGGRWRLSGSSSLRRATGQPAPFQDRSPLKGDGCRPGTAPRRSRCSPCRPGFPDP